MAGYWEVMNKLLSIFKSSFKAKRLWSQAGFIRLTKKSLVMGLIALTVFTGSGLYFLMKPKPAFAAWYYDNRAYRQTTFGQQKIRFSADFLTEYNADALRLDLSVNTLSQNIVDVKYVVLF